jgi:CO dehydrogenase/acetyl-CoA synthase beta subunit
MPYLYYFRILFRVGTIASSILFGLAFYVITRNVNAGKVKDYLAITAIGITIVGIANETSALHQTYGATVHSLVLLSSYLFTVGLYSAALSISQDSSLRRSIRKTIPELLDDIGTAQMEQELEKRILKIVKENKEKLEEETGGISYSLTEDDIKVYLEQVLQEKKKS